MIECGKTYRRIGTTFWYGRVVHADWRVREIRDDRNYPSGRVVVFDSRYPEVDPPGKYPASGFADYEVFERLCAGEETPSPKN